MGQNTEFLNEELGSEGLKVYQGVGSTTACPPSRPDSISLAAMQIPNVTSIAARRLQRFLSILGKLHLMFPNMPVLWTNWRPQ